MNRCPNPLPRVAPRQTCLLAQQARGLKRRSGDGFSDLRSVRTSPPDSNAGGIFLLSAASGFCADASRHLARLPSGVLGRTFLIDSPKGILSDAYTDGYPYPSSFSLKVSFADRILVIAVGFILTSGRQKSAARYISGKSDEVWFGGWATLVGSWWARSPEDAAKRANIGNVNG